MKICRKQNCESETALDVMRFSTNIDVSNFYSNFVNLDKQEFDVIIREYQENESLIDMLATDQRIELQIIYLEALYQIGKYGVFLRKVDETIEDVIRYNFEPDQDDKIFEKLLFKKATALFHQGHIGKAEYITRELLKIDSEETLYQALLTRIFYKKNETRFNYIKILCLVLIAISTVVYGINLLLIQPLTGEYYKILFDMGFATLNAGVLVYVLGEIILFCHAVFKSRRIVRKYRNRQLMK